MTRDGMTNNNNHFNAKINQQKIIFFSINVNIWVDFERNFSYCILNIEL